MKNGFSHLTIGACCIIDLQTFKEQPVKCNLNTIITSCMDGHQFWAVEAKENPYGLLLEMTKPEAEINFFALL